jgi:hypothetical protein
LEVPKPVRYWWGALRNLISGVTTVCHHNPYAPEVFASGFPVRVVSRYGWAHSLAFTPNVVESFRAAPADAPIIIHLAEGTDQRSRGESFHLDKIRALDSRTVIVHGARLDHEG